VKLSPSLGISRSTAYKTGRDGPAAPLARREPRGRAGRSCRQVVRRDERIKW